VNQRNSREAPLALGNPEFARHRDWLANGGIALEKLRVRQRKARDRVQFLPLSHGLA
jgi:hypothetical protein